MNTGKIFEKSFRKSIPDSENVYCYRLKDGTASWNMGNSKNVRFQAENIADFFFGIIVIDAHTDGTVSDLMRKPYGEQNMRRIETAGSAGRARRCADSVHIEHKKNGFSFDILKRNVQCSRKRIFGSVQFCVRNTSHQFIAETVSHFANP